MIPTLYGGSFNVDGTVDFMLTDDDGQESTHRFKLACKVPSFSDPQLAIAAVLYTLLKEREDE